MAFDRDVYSGSSGAPVVDRSIMPTRIVAMISGGSRTQQATISPGMELPSLPADLKHAPHTGRVVRTSGSAGAARLRAGADHRAAGHLLRP